MPPTETPSVTVSPRGPGHLDSDPLRTVVWVRGEHDIATRLLLSVTFDEAAHLDDADIVVDLSGVTFMDASTIGALVVARDHLQALSRSLTVRAPSPRARRVVDLCGLGSLIDEDPTPAQLPVATALGTWVDVPARDPEPDSAEPPPVADEALSPEPEPARIVARRGAEPGASLQQPRAAS